MLTQIFANDVLIPVAQVKTGTVTGFLPMVGREYSGQLMVVGRAVNGWTEGIAPSQLLNDALRFEYALSVKHSVTKTMPGQCPMSWVTACWSAAEGASASGLSRRREDRARGCHQDARGFSGNRY